MDSIYRDIFKAIHEGKWLSIEYRNMSDQLTKYWIGIRGLNLRKKSLTVEGLHLGKYSIESFNTIYIDSIVSSQVIEGSFYPVNESLVRDIALNPHKYKILFDNVANLKILSYLEDCNRMDTTPYKSDFSLVQYLDGDSFRGGGYPLNEEQFRTIVRNFQRKSEREREQGGPLRLQQLALNVMSLHTSKGLYVLAYKRLNLDVKARMLVPEKDVTVCTEFALDGGVKQSIRRYLDAEDYGLLESFEANQEMIKDKITQYNWQNVEGVDDMPYIIGLGMDVSIDLHKEYAAIIDMYHTDQVTMPIKAFFGDLLDRPVRTKSYPITPLDNRINLDQLLAINNAMKYPVAYIQGPPGSDKYHHQYDYYCIFQ